LPGLFLFLFFSVFAFFFSSSLRAEGAAIPSFTTLLDSLSWFYYSGFVCPGFKLFFIYLT